MLNSSVAALAAERAGSARLSSKGMSAYVRLADRAVGGVSLRGLFLGIGRGTWRGCGDGGSTTLRLSWTAIATACFVQGHCRLL